MEKYSKKYQHKVIDRLNKKGSLSDSQKILWDFGVTLGSITKYFGVRIDFVIDNQSGFLNIANKVSNQTSKKSIINIAGIVKNQIQNIGIQFAKHSDNQKMFLGTQISNENYNKQILGYGLQSTNKGKTQVINSGVQIGNVLNWSNQVSRGFGIQVVEILTGNQLGNKGIQVGDTISGNQYLKKGYQFGKYVGKNQKVDRGISVK